MRTQRFPMSLFRHRRTAARTGFTLVEIMIVVGVIALLAVLALPSFLKARKQSQGRRIVNDARILEAAVDQWAIEHNKKDGDAIDTWSANGIVSYTNNRWRVLPLGAWIFNDVLGNAYGFGVVGSSPQVRINFTTRTALAGVGIDWGPY